MFKNYTLIVALLFYVVTAGRAQTNTSGATAKKGCSCSFSSINQAGLATGEKGSYFLAQTINGIRYKTWFVGAGLGLDTYRSLTAPVFLDVRKNLFNKTATPFVYADGGMQFAVKKNERKNDFSNTDYSTGLYYDLGIGYQVGLKNKHAFLMSAGYSVKNTEERLTTNYGEFICITHPCYSGYASTYKYRLNRISLKLGYRF
jgi:hypothetical protein